MIDLGPREHIEYGMDGVPTGRIVRVTKSDEEGRCEAVEVRRLSQEEIDAQPARSSDGCALSMTVGQHRRMRTT